MKYILFFFLTLSLSVCAYSQEIPATKGPVFSEFGQVYAIEDPELILDADTTYKVIFDIYTDEKKSSVMNPLLNTVARFMNMHAQTGLAEEHMKIAVVLHGSATKNALTPAAFKKKYRHDHPNSDLLEALDDKGVAIFVCGQSVKSKGYDTKDISGHVNISLSALTALVKYQSEGYQLINFN